MSGRRSLLEDLGQHAPQASAGSQSSPGKSLARAAAEQVRFQSMHEAPEAVYQVVTSTWQLVTVMEGSRDDTIHIRVVETPFIEFPFMNVTLKHFTLDCGGAAVDGRNADIFREGANYTFDVYNCVLFHPFDVDSRALRNREATIVSCHLVGYCSDEGAAVLPGPNEPLVFANHTYRTGTSESSAITLKNCTLRCLDDQDVELMMDILGRPQQPPAVAPSPASFSGGVTGGTSHTSTLALASIISSAVVLVALCAVLAWWACVRRRRAAAVTLKQDVSFFFVPPPPSLSYQQQRASAWVRSHGSRSFEPNPEAAASPAEATANQEAVNGDSPGRGRRSSRFSDVSRDITLWESIMGRSRGPSVDA